MNREKPDSGSNDAFLSRWSKRKHEAKRGAETTEPPPTIAAPPASPIEQRAGDPEAPMPLPDVESLTPDSDFTPFMREGVPASLKRNALKTLFQDPRFNVMDGLDVYIDDFSKPDPLPEGWLEKMNQVARLGEYREPEPKPEVEATETVETPETVEASPESAAPEPLAEPSAEAAAAVSPDTAIPPQTPLEVPES